MHTIWRRRTRNRFRRLGRASAHLIEALDQIKADIARLSRPIPRNHRLAPGRILKDAKSHWRVGDPYRDIHVYLLIGRRRHYGAKENEVRDKLCQEASDIARSAFVQIMSYDRIFDIETET